MTECPKHLCYVTGDKKGICREIKSRKTIYRDTDGSVIKDKKVLERIESLVIPPNWTDVWICSNKNGHLQATGRDQRGRKQYIYHPEWVEFRQDNKYRNLAKFGRSLPRIRRKLNEHLKKKEFDKEKTMALAVKLLDCKYLRIGNDLYLGENETYGLTTIRRKHLQEAKDSLTISYTAKSGKSRNISITNKKLVNLLKEINELPGYEVFRYSDNGKTYPIMSEDVNKYIREISGEQISAKDFRTWGGTIAAIDEYPRALASIEVSPRRKLETEIIRRVAKILGNTVSTAREYYIHPVVLEALVENGPEKYFTKKTEAIYKNNYLKKNEAIAIRMIENH